MLSKRCSKAPFGNTLSPRIDAICRHTISSLRAQVACSDPAPRDTMVSTSELATGSSACGSHTGEAMRDAESVHEEAECVSVPELRLLRAMNIPTVHTHAYQQRFGPATAIHPYGARVHEGLVDLVRSSAYTHRGRFLGPPHVQYCLWIYYSSPYNKRQMRTRLGEHPDDVHGGMWFAAVGDWHNGEWCAVCLGAAWANGPPWRIHPSRVVVCLPHSQQLALARALTLPYIEIVENMWSRSASSSHEPAVQTPDITEVDGTDTDGWDWQQEDIALDVPGDSEWF